MLLILPRADVQLIHHYPNEFNPSLVLFNCCRTIYENLMGTQEVLRQSFFLVKFLSLSQPCRNRTYSLGASTLECYHYTNGYDEINPSSNPSTNREIGRFTNFMLAYSLFHSGAPRI